MFEFLKRKRAPKPVEGDDDLVQVSAEHLSLVLTQNMQMAKLLEQLTEVNKKFEAKLTEYHRVYRFSEELMALLIARDDTGPVLAVNEQHRHLAMKIQEVSRKLISALEMEPLFFPPEETIH